MDWCIFNCSTNSQTTGFRKSSCPVEKGVMNTKNYGTVSLSNVLIAIAATLKPMEIPLTYVLEDAVDHFQNESISNKWVSIMGGKYNPKENSRASILNAGIKLSHKR